MVGLVVVMAAIANIPGFDRNEARGYLMKTQAHGLDSPLLAHSHLCFPYGAKPSRPVS